MQDLTLRLPADSLIGIRLPPRNLSQELQRRLAAALFSDGILSGAAACRMADMTKAEFQFMLGERGLPQPLQEADYVQDVSHLEAWRNR